MISPLFVAVRIWVKSVLMTIVILSINILLSNELFAILFLLGALLVGFFITSPLLIVISPLVEWSSLMPYANRSKNDLADLFTICLYLLIFIGLASLIQGNFNGMFSKEVALLFLSIIVVEFIAVRTTRKSLYKLYEQNTWPQE